MSSGLSWTPSCHACGSSRIRGVSGIEAFSAISSDIRMVGGPLSLAVCQRCGLLQKLVTDAWADAVEGVYREYEINHQSGGTDPVIFKSRYGQGPRAEILVKHLLSQLGATPTGSMLDIGCASGNILRSFGEARPAWLLHGMDKSEQWRSSVLEIAGVQGFFSAIEDLSDERFDLIVMSHVLEHIPGPAAYLRRLVKHLTPNGILFIAVPDIRQNPIDLFVLDHCTHFDEPTLATNLNRGGFAPFEFSAEILGKEIVALSKPIPVVHTPSPLIQPYAMPLDAVAEKYLALCKDLLDHARKRAADHPNFGVMGTSTAAAWLLGELNSLVSFFVDEDSNRIGHTAFEKPIYSLAQIPLGACVFIPMSNHTAEAIIARAQRSDVSFAYLPWNQIDDVTARVN